MDKAVTLSASLLRVVFAYLAACLACGLAMFIMGLVAGLADTPAPGLSRMDEIVNQTAMIPIVAGFAAVFALPIAVIAILVSEIAKIASRWFFVVAGALAALPTLLRGDTLTAARALEDLAVLLPLGAIAGFTYWLVRHRQWPI